MSPLDNFTSGSFGIFRTYVLDDKKQSLQSVRHYLALLKKVCRIAYKEGHSERYFFCNFKLPKQEISAPKALTREDRS